MGVGGEQDAKRDAVNPSLHQGHICVDIFSNILLSLGADPMSTPTWLRHAVALCKRGHRDGKEDKSDGGIPLRWWGIC